MDWERVKKDDKECNCCIRIEDSFVIIICGEIDPKQLKDCLKTFIDVKGNTVVANNE